MRYAKIRKRHLQSERLWVQLMAQPNGFIAPKSWVSPEALDELPAAFTYTRREEGHE